MGCTPSRRLSFRHAMGDPFHTAVMPLGPYSPYDAWTGHQFLEPALPFLHDPTYDFEDEPPPYTEVAMEGHVTVIRSQSPRKLDGTFESSRAMNDSSSVLERSTSAVLPLDMQRPGTSSMEFMDETQAAPSTCCSNAENSRLSQSLGQETSFLENSFTAESALPQSEPQTNSIFPRRTVSRSLSMDAGYGSMHRHPRRDTHSFTGSQSSLERHPGRPAIFPPRPGTLQPIQGEPVPCYPPPLLPIYPMRTVQPYPMCARSHHPMPPSVFTRPPNLQPSHFPLPPPTRLPPIQPQPPTQEAQKQHRKKHKRRRGHTWHGEGLPSATTH